MSDFNDHRIINRAELLSDVYELGEAAIDEALNVISDGDVARVISCLHRAAAFREASHEIAALTKHALYVPDEEHESIRKANYDPILPDRDE